MSADRFIGTAGWSIPKQHAGAFPPNGSSLVRYASVFNATEINSTFYRSHRASTFQRWRDSVPEGFRFAVKVPKAITHEAGLSDAGQAFVDFTSTISGLGSKLGPLLLQLPPKLEFEASIVEKFLNEVTAAGNWTLVVEPRHASWFSGAVNQLLDSYGVARVGADPQRVPDGLLPGGSRRLTYLRLHGSPRIYFDAYHEDFIADLATRIASDHRLTWCIFDNTASGAAAGDAIGMMHKLRQEFRGD